MNDNRKNSGWGGKREGAGRPPGSTSKRLRELRALLDPHKEQLVTKAVEMALEGDSTSLRLCMERIFPAIKSRDETIAVELTGETLKEKAESVLALGMTGDVSISELNSLMQTVSTMARIIDVDDLERRITVLEEK